MRRFQENNMLEEGESVLTVSGRQTEPFPRLSFETNRKALNTIKRVDAWLRNEAIQEAKVRKDEFNLRQFEASDGNRLTQAEKDSFELYLVDRINSTKGI